MILRGVTLKWTNKPPLNATFKLTWKPSQSSFSNAMRIRFVCRASWTNSRITWLKSCALSQTTSLLTHGRWIYDIWRCRRWWHATIDSWKRWIGTTQTVSWSRKLLKRMCWTWGTTWEGMSNFLNMNLELIDWKIRRKVIFWRLPQKCKSMSNWRRKVWIGSKPFVWSMGWQMRWCELYLTSKSTCQARMAPMRIQKEKHRCSACLICLTGSEKSSMINTSPTILND